MKPRVKKHASGIWQWSCDCGKSGIDAQHYYAFLGAELHVLYDHQEVP